ncbi:DUF1254 domain-containing protein [Rhodopila globiformis]|uniref:DUF1254 domain-containing protein n=1 Tax=Rhodopila globiformis TaxID=1071 RepID=A0A2S6N4N5_RHOGL|nr:DUF1254 domain-containing protein [Rhodopila globiformis]PPQ29559.1 hypothetical protein CCS01_21100 [Rhodopila globiformis]
MGFEAMAGGAWRDHALTGRMVMRGPDRIAPAFRMLTGPSSDTLCASSFLDLTAEPIIVTAPETTVRYSIVAYDPCFEALPISIPAQTPGVYGLTGSGFSGQLPAGITPVPMPVSFPIIPFRVDLFSAVCEDQTDAATAFRASLKMQPLSKYLADPAGGSANIVPVISFAPLGSINAKGDASITKDPIAYLQQLQAIVASPHTPPLSPDA